MRSAWLEIDLDALSSNICRIRERVGPETRVMGVVKANGYGHGLAPAARAALAGGAAMLGVALPEEAGELREAGIDAPIVILGAPLPDAADEIARTGASQVVSCRGAIRAISAAASAAGREVGLHLKLDTGMGRVGADPRDAVPLAREIAALPGVRLEGVCTHFATSDEDATYLAIQDGRFRDALAALAAAGVSSGLRHAANSGAVQAGRDTDYDMVRPGLLMYGCPPLPDAGPELAPALRWKSRLVQVRDIPAGARIGYGLTARLSRDSRLAIVPLGYADGWPRSLSNRGRVLVRGGWAPVIGRVSMDQFTVDVTDIPGARLGDEVVLIGEQGAHRQTLDDVAASAGTNAHDLLAGLGARLPRVYR